MARNTQEEEKPPVRTQPAREPCRHPLTTDQLVEAGKDLADSQSELRQLEDDFKSVRDEWKSRISMVEARITTTAGRISRGYDIRDTACTIIFDMPNPNLKTCVRDDNGDRVWVREMTESDKQLTLNMDEEVEE